jgi:hypothetical protein
MVDIEQKAKGIVLESCLVASSIGCAMRGAIIFVHQKAFSSVHCFTSPFLTPVPSSLSEISYPIKS